MAGKPLAIDRFPGEREARWQESLLMFGSQTRIAKKVGVLRNPQNAFRSELLPTMGAGDSTQNSVRDVRARAIIRIRFSC